MSLRDKAEKAKITWGQPGWIQNEIFVAAASPDKILELLDQMERVIEAIDQATDGTGKSYPPTRAAMQVLANAANYLREHLDQ